MLIPLFTYLLGINSARKSLRLTLHCLFIEFIMLESNESHWLSFYLIVEWLFQTGLTELN